MYIEESFDTIFNMGYWWEGPYVSGKSPMLLRVKSTLPDPPLPQIRILFSKFCPFRGLFGAWQKKAWLLKKKKKN